MDCRKMFRICGKRKSKAYAVKKSSIKTVEIKPQSHVIDVLPLRAQIPVEIIVVPSTEKKSQLPPSILAKTIIRVAPKTVKISYESRSLSTRFFPEADQEYEEEWVVRCLSETEKIGYINRIAKILNDKIESGGVPSGLVVGPSSTLIDPIYLNVQHASIEDFSRTSMSAFSLTQGWIRINNSRFMSDAIHYEGIERYLLRLVRGINLSVETLVSMLVLIERYFKHNPGEFLNNYNVHRLLCAALFVGNIVLNDFFVTKRSFGICAGVSLSEMKTLICALLNAIDHKAFVTEEEYKTMRELIEIEMREEILKESLPGMAHELVSTIGNYAGQNPRFFAEKPKHQEYKNEIPAERIHVIN